MVVTTLVPVLLLALLFSFGRGVMLMCRECRYFLQCRDLW